tara:strand:+ start:5808 stop:6992 length:1185 start_codon:yes stop_codon:yes gene_type:complete
MVEHYKICKRCIMDTSDPEIYFFKDGNCNHCTDHIFKQNMNKKYFTKQRFDLLISEIKKSGKNKQYDCVVGVSGGVDSSYVLYLSKKLGLRPLAVHFDNGWNSEIAVQNIEKIITKLDIDLFTEVVDWETFREILISFLYASTPDSDLATDHGIRATLWKAASKHKIKYILNGRNNLTEGILPWSWAYSALDWKFISSVYRKHTNKRLKKFPHISLFNMIYKMIFVRFKNINILDFIQYSNDIAKNKLINEFDWKSYGKKHDESLYTKFIYSFLHPKKFKFDKRRAYLSALICSGLITREDAMIELSKKSISLEEEKELKEYVQRKLSISEKEMKNILNKKTRSFSHFPNNSFIFLMHKNNNMINLLKLLRFLKIMPRGFGDNMIAMNNHKKIE